MPPAATLLTGKAYAPRIELSREGNRVTTNYLVTSVIANTAITATGLPEIGDAYGTSVPGSYLQRIRSTPLGGGVASPGNPDQNGWSVLECSYGPPDQTGITPDLSSWTEANPSVRSERVYRALDPATGEPEIGEGKHIDDGVTIQIGWMEVAVHTYHTGSVSSALMGYIRESLSPKLKVNTAGIVLPRYGSPNSMMTLSLGPEQALYLTHSLRESSPGVLELVHYMAVSKDHLVTITVADEFNNTGSSTNKPFYASESFAGLW